MYHTVVVSGTFQPLGAQDVVFQSCGARIAGLHGCFFMDIERLWHLFFHWFWKFGLPDFFEHVTFVEGVSGHFILCGIGFGVLPLFICWTVERKIRQRITSEPVAQGRRIEFIEIADQSSFFVQQHELC